MSYTTDFKTLLTRLNEGTQVELNDMMRCREHRAMLQNVLFEKYHAPLLSFTLNIPGPIKNNSLLSDIFYIGIKSINAIFNNHQIHILQEHYSNEITGNEYICAFDGNADDVKNEAITLENTHPLGRLFDIDIIDPKGHKLSRRQYRSCLICNKQAQDCARNRTHSIEEMQLAILKLIKESNLIVFK